MMQSIGKRAGRGPAVLGHLMILVAIGVAAGALTVCRADDPKPDPAGINDWRQNDRCRRRGEPFCSK